MTSPKDADLAPGRAQAQRFVLRKLLQINRANAAPPDLELCEKVIGAATPQDYDALLASPAVQSLFARSVLFCGTAR